MESDWDGVLDNLYQVNDGRGGGRFMKCDTGALLWSSEGMCCGDGGRSGEGGMGLKLEQLGRRDGCLVRDMVG